MKAEIDASGVLILKPESKTEDYALDKWIEEKAGCSLTFELDRRKDIVFEEYKHHKPPFLSRIKHKIELFYINHIKK